MKKMHIDEVTAKMKLMGCMIFACAIEESTHGVTIATCYRHSDGCVFDLCFDPEHPEQREGYYFRIPPPHIVLGVLTAVAEAKAKGVPMDNSNGFTEISRDSETCNCDACKAKRATSPAVQAAVDGILSLK